MKEAGNRQLTGDESVLQTQHRCVNALLPVLVFCTTITGDDHVLLNVVDPGQLTAADALHRSDAAALAAGVDPAPTAGEAHPAETRAAAARPQPDAGGEGHPPLPPTLSLTGIGIGIAVQQLRKR